MRSTAHGSASGATARTTQDLVGPVVEPILADVIAALEARGRGGCRGHGHRPVGDRDDEFAALLCEFKTDIATYLETYVDGTNPVTGEAYPQTLAELIEFNQAHPDLEGPWNDASSSSPRRRTVATRRAPTSAQTVTPPVQDAIDQLMADNDLDAIIALTNGPAWPTNDNPEEGDLDGHFEYFVGSSTAAAVSGYADITVPAGDIEGLPIGITFIGGRWAEPELIGFAYDYEQATQVRVPPQFIPTIGDDLFPGVPNPPLQAQAQRQQATQGAISPCASGRGISRRQRSPAIRPGFVCTAGSPREPTCHTGCGLRADPHGDRLVLSVTGLRQSSHYERR